MLLAQVIWIALSISLTTTHDHIDQENVPCTDTLSHTICTQMAAKKEFCKNELTSRKCMKSCGICGGPNNGVKGSISTIMCKDEMPPSICSKMKGKFCQDPKTNKRCRKSCGLCGETDTATLPLPTEVKKKQTVYGNGAGQKSSEDSNTPCKDDMPPTVCSHKKESKFCQLPITNRECMKSCGLCTGPINGIKGSISTIMCKDEMPPSICSKMKGKFCQDPKTNRRCRKSCGLCGGPNNGVIGSISTILCKDEMPPSICSKMKGKFCQDPKTNKRCRKSCGLCGATDATPLPLPTGGKKNKTIDANGAGQKSREDSNTSCKDDMPPAECSQKVKSKFCTNPKKKILCRKSCGLCDDMNHTMSLFFKIPCKDEMSNSACSLVTRSQFCRRPETNQKCRRSCGLCNVEGNQTSSTKASTLCKAGADCSQVTSVPHTEAPCEDLMTQQTLCSELVKKPNFCSHPQQQINCRKTCKLCGNVTFQTTSSYTDANNGAVLKDEISNSQNNQTDLDREQNGTSELHKPDSPGGNYTTDEETNSARKRDNNTTVELEVDKGVQNNDTLDTVDVSTAGNTIVGGSHAYRNNDTGNTQTDNATTVSSPGFNSTAFTNNFNDSRNQNENNRQNYTTDIYQGDIAWQKPATQSSTMKGHDASLVTGLSVSGSTGCAQTSEDDPMPWWRVDLERAHTVTSVTITNSEDPCCCEKLLKVSIDLFMESDQEDPINCNFIEKRFKCGEQRTVTCMPNSFGRYLKISKSLPGLSLCTVKVLGSPVVGKECPELIHTNYPEYRHRPMYYMPPVPRGVGAWVRVKGCSKGMSLVGKSLLKCLENNHWDSPVPVCIDDITTNIAYRKPSTQSSEGSGPASNAVNGRTVSTTFDDTCSATSATESHPWWRVELGDTYTVHNVTIVNRHDQICKRLSNLTITLVSPNKTEVECARSIPAFSCGETRTITCNSTGTQGRAVQISKPTPGLYLCEVVVRGVKVHDRTVECEPLKIPVKSSFAVSRPVLSTHVRSAGTVVNMSCPSSMMRLGIETTVCLPDGKWRDRSPFCMYKQANIAYQKQTEMSSMVPTTKPELVVDGILQHGNCATTGPRDQSPWIKVDLGTNYEVKKVYLVPEGKSCSAPLRITVLGDVKATPKAAGQVCATRRMQHCGTLNEIDCAGHLGKALLIGQSSPHLSLCEVLISGKLRSKDCPRLLRKFKPVRDVYMPKLSSYKTVQGALVTMSCSSDYRLLGEQATECLPGGKWSNPNALCISMRGNVAFNKTVRLSSLRAGTSSKTAVDGTIRRGALCAQTKPTDDFPWIKIDLGGLHQINAVVIAVGENSCKSKYPLFIKIQMDVNERHVKNGVPCNGPVFIKTCYGPQLIDCKTAATPVQPKGKSVVIVHERPQLDVCEVVVLGKKMKTDCPPLTGRDFTLSTKKTTEGELVRIHNCARGMAVAGPSVLRCLASGQWDVAIPQCIDMKRNVVKSHPTSMSSSLGKQNGAFAVDGVFDGGKAAGMCSQTTLFDTEPWWQVDMLTSHRVYEVIITNRHDCCCDLLRDFDILVYGDEELPRHPKAQGTLCNHVTSPFQCGETRKIRCQTRPSGRYVRIRKKQTGLTLCEVVVVAEELNGECPRLDTALLPKGLVSKNNLNRLKLSSRRRRVGAMIQLGCLHNYKLRGPNKLSCVLPGKWNKRKPQCVPTGVKLNLWCPIEKGYFYDVGSDFCFRLETEAADWYHSLNACSSQSASRLADLDSDGKYTSVVEAIMSSEKYRNSNFHVGANRFINPSTWTWMSKKDVNFKTHKLDMKHLNQRCAALSPVTGKLKAQSCTVKGSRVCQMEKPKPGPVPCSDAMIPETCGTKAIKGFCDAEKSSIRFKTMTTKCKRTCGFCITRSRRCKDRYKPSSCKSKQKVGACSSPNVRQKCIKTCGRCPKIIPTSPPPPIGCTDEADDPEQNCHFLKLTKGCHNPETKTLCKRTCNICSGGSCRDKMDVKRLKCPKITKNGSHCPEKYKMICSKSCGCPYYTKCGLTKSFTAIGESMSPLYPSPYPSSAACQYIISVPRNTESISLQVLLEVFGINEDDSLKIQNSAFVTNAPKDRHEIMSFMVTKRLTLTFNSATSSSGKGFIIKWKPMAERRGDTIWQSCSCTAKEMQIELISLRNKAHMKYSLADPNCQLSSKQRAMYTLKIALTSCHTIREETETSVVYSNTVQSVSQGTGTVHNIIVPVKCRFPRTAMTSESTGEIQGKDKLTISMDLYVDMRRVSQYPAAVNTSSRISIILSVLPMLRKVNVIPQTCFVAEKDTSGKWSQQDFFVKDGCYREATVMKRPGMLKMNVLRNDFLKEMTTRYVVCDVRRCETASCQHRCGLKKPKTDLLRLVQGPILVLPKASTKDERTTEHMTETTTKIAATSMTTSTSPVGTPTSITTPSPTTSSTRAPATVKAGTELGLTPPGITDSLPKFTIERTDSGVVSTTERSGDIQLPAVDDQDAPSVSTGTIVGVSVGAVMVLVMGLTLAAIKYGPRISVFKRRPAS